HLVRAEGLDCVANVVRSGSLVVVLGSGLAHPAVQFDCAACVGKNIQGLEANVLSSTTHARDISVFKRTKGIKLPPERNKVRGVGSAQEVRETVAPDLHDILVGGCEKERLFSLPPRAAMVAEVVCISHGGEIHFDARSNVDEVPVLSVFDLREECVSVDSGCIPFKVDFLVLDKRVSVLNFLAPELFVEGAKHVKSHGG